MNLKPGQHIHLMGICGTAMASLAGLLKTRGFKVTGSDSNPYPPMSTQLESLGISIMKPYSAKNLSPKPDFVIVGNVISANNEEAQELEKLKIPHTSLPKAMGEFIIENRDCICISGTHGKTTTTSMMSWLCEVAGLKPGFLIGGIPKNFTNSFQNPQGNIFVIEGDEYDTAFFDKVPKFVHYKPKNVILTSVEFDHADIYKDLAAVKAAFAKLMELIPQSGSLICWAEDKNIEELKAKAKTSNIFTYGFEKGDYRPEVISEDSTYTTFKVKFKNETLGQFQIKLSGSYNILNATAVIAQAHYLKIDIATIQKALSSFEGVKRRQEIRGEPAGVLVIEDFAHHPTAVRETLKGMRSRYGQKKIFAVFEPRSATSRRKVFQKDYVEAFTSADEILLAQAFDQTKLNDSDKFSSEELVQDLKNIKKSAQVFSKADLIVEDLVKRTKSGDVVVIMSNGGFDGIYDKLLSALAARG